jgi:hypothetical protein
MLRSGGMRYADFSIIAAFFAASKGKPAHAARSGRQLKSRWNFASFKAVSERPSKFNQLLSGDAFMTDPVLTPEQETEAQRLAALIGKKVQEEALQMMRIMVSKPDRQLLGATEFEIRDRAHRLAAHAIETALNERKKGGTKARP